MQKNNYESAVIINAAIEEDQIEAAIKRIEDIIRVNGGEMVDVDKWGRKRLAYTVNKTKSGYYVIIRFVAPPELISKLERMYQLDEYILRYLTIKLDKFALEYLDKSKALKDQEKLDALLAESAETLPGEILANEV
ncbi:MAG: 30S ribosomal protein S6 [Ignavibacteriales bacterium]|nr:30S ribosomal protein S6 [Ignavibacteriales bacterium]